MVWEYFASWKSWLSYFFPSWIFERRWLPGDDYIGLQHITALDFPELLRHVAATNCRSGPKPTNENWKLNRGWFYHTKSSFRYNYHGKWGCRSPKDHLPCGDFQWAFLRWPFIPTDGTCGGNSTIFGIFTPPKNWGFMIQFDYMIFFKWIGSTTNSTCLIFSGWQSHTIHVWYIYLHWPYFTIKNNQM